MGAQAALDDIDTFVDSVDELKLTDPKEFRDNYEGVMSAETMVGVM